MTNKADAQAKSPISTGRVTNLGLRAIKTAGRRTWLREKAAEGRTPGRWRAFRERIEPPKVLECGCPLPLSSAGDRDRHTKSHPLSGIRLNIRWQLRRIQGCAAGLRYSSFLSFTSRGVM